jgi:hypothetical protein
MAVMSTSTPAAIPPAVRMKREPVAAGGSWPPPRPASVTCIVRPGSTSEDR